MKIKPQYRIPFSKAKQVLEDALGLADKDSVRIDKLNCSVSIFRERSTLTIQELFKKVFEEKVTTHFHFIYRDMSFLPQNFIENGKNPNRNFWDVGLTTYTSPEDYFLFIDLEEDDGKKLISKFDLKLVDHGRWNLKVRSLFAKQLGRKVWESCSPPSAIFLVWGNWDA